MTELTFAELTALIAANGLTVNDRYLITDKNWTIVAITTNAYRIVVPIVTEVTKAQLDALVAADGLNEGLQYKVADKGWLLLAISNSKFTIISTVPYKSYICLLSQSETNSPVPTIIENTIGDIVWSRADPGYYLATLPGAFTVNKTIVLVGTRWINNGTGYVSGKEGSVDFCEIYTSTTIAGDGSDSIMTREYIEIRVYF